MGYRVESDGIWVQPVMRGYRLACCDCGLIHVIDFRIRNGRVQFKPRRDTKATWARRKRTALTTERREG